MATLNAVIVPAKVLKNGRHKIRISVAHNGETRYIVTSILIDSIKQFKNGTIIKRPDAAMLNTKIRSLMMKYQDVIDNLAYPNGLSCPELVYLIKNAGNDKNRTLWSIYEEYMNNANIKAGTLKSYNFLWRVMGKYFGDSVLVEHISYGSIMGFEKFLRNRGLSTSTMRNYLIFLSSLLNYAKKCGYVEFKVDPFAGYSLPPTHIRDSWISVDEVKKIRDLESSRLNIIKCRDLFMLSYYLGGINMVDMVKINFNEQNNILRYIRTKTETRSKLNKYVEFKIPQEAKSIIDRYKSKDGYLRVSEIDRKSSCNAFFHYNMPMIAKMTGIKNLIFYSARKSFSQHAFDLGISTSVIDYILGHSLARGGTSLYSYISVTPKMATDAIRKVLDNLK